MYNVLLITISDYEQTLSLLKATDISKMFCSQILSTVLYLLYFHQMQCYILYSRFMLMRPSGEQLTKLQPGMIDHPVQRDSYSCGVIVIKVGALHLYLLLYFAYHIFQEC